MPYVFPPICCRRKQGSACTCQHLLAARTYKVPLAFAARRKTEGLEAMTDKDPSHKRQSLPCSHKAVRSVSNSILHRNS